MTIAIDLKEKVFFLMLIGPCSLIWSSVVVVGYVCSGMTSSR